MKKQKENSGQPLKGSKKTGNEATKKVYPKELHLNLVHLLFLHGLASRLYAADKESMDVQWRSFVHDMCLIMETYIDQIDAEDMKNKMNYKPIPEEDEEDSQDEKPE